MLRLAVHASPSGILIVEAGGEIVFANEALLGMFEYELDELLGTQQLWQRDNKLNELYEQYGRDAVDDLCRRRPDLELSEVAEMLAVREPATSGQ